MSDPASAMDREVQRRGAGGGGTQGRGPGGGGGAGAVFLAARGETPASAMDREVQRRGAAEAETVARCSVGHGWLRLVSSTALRISRVTASGCDTNDECEAATSSMWALARSAMNRCAAGGMARSSVP